VRDPGDAKYASLRAVGEVSDLGQAAAGGEVVLLALPGAAAADFASEHAEAVEGKVGIDAPN
jgi:predicted dinucleotide-binding enzyme